MVGEDKIEVSVQEELNNVARAIQRVTSSIFEKGGTAGKTIKRSRKSAQFTFRIRDSKKKRTVEQVAQRKMMKKAFSEKAVMIENEIRKH